MIRKNIIINSQTIICDLVKILSEADKLGLYDAASHVEAAIIALGGPGTPLRPYEVTP